jgi:hypothetical protein
MGINVENYDKFGVKINQARNKKARQLAGFNQKAGLRGAT